MLFNELLEDIVLQNTTDNGGSFVAHWRVSWLSAARRDDNDLTSWNNSRWEKFRSDLITASLVSKGNVQLVSAVFTNLKTYRFSLIINGDMTRTKCSRAGENCNISQETRTGRTGCSERGARLLRMRSESVSICGTTYKITRDTEVWHLRQMTV